MTDQAFPEDRSYTKEHEWVHIAADGPVPGGAVRGPVLAPRAAGEVVLDRRVVRVGEFAQQEVIQFAVSRVCGGHRGPPRVIPFQGVLPF